MTQRSNDFKVVLLGEGRVGKTSLLVRFVENRFNDTEQATVKVELSLWDTAGQERFHSLGPIYYRDAAAALLVFDITDIDSFERVKAWVKELRQMAGPDLVLAIAANKSDLEAQRSVPEATATAFAAEIGASHFATSAKTGAGLEAAFVDIARRCLERQHARLTREGSVGGTGQSARRRHGGIVIADDSVPTPASSSSGCC